MAKRVPLQTVNLKLIKIVKSLGGLFVIGTERMESRRVDNQARGRAGRQGDEGNSIFYVSLEDDLMRIFGSESMNKMLEKLGLKDGESIDHPWINKALERAQQKVEARNFDIRNFISRDIFLKFVSIKYTSSYIAVRFFPIFVFIFWVHDIRSSIL